MRRALTAATATAGAVAVLWLLFDEPPDDASVSDFCAAYDLAVDVGEPAGGGVRAWVDRMAEVGTPSDMPPAARAGFERHLAYLEAATDPDTRPDDPDLYLTESERADRRAFEDYAQESCASGDRPPLSRDIGSDG
jgi:hypothetical protein